MAYTRAKAERYLSRVRRYIDQVPFNNEDTSDEPEAAESVSTSIPDDFILQSINSASKAITSRAKACHVYDAIVEENLSSSPTSPSNVVVRLLKGSQKFNGNRAVMRDADRARRLEGTKQGGSDSKPVYTYEDGEISFYPSPDYNNGDTVTIRYVGSPDEVTSFSDEMPLDERFEAAIVYYVAAECFQRIRRMGLEQIARQQYESEVQAFGLGTRTSRLDGAEVATE